ncbi:hypothetical protein [Nitrospirillum viridazoti]|uniref:Uncharacterized protein n=1 Tax=Nitrospirillum viridazoti CBAmc TaxID=1441467 RepID=A0A248JVF7_9PROT|nr:hypothetical protein [Nitrospirillum amazonense]ASG22204.1 hypothetical protein Y958_14655 [Nitrospirillum amazonense CBAmc]TWB31034.1 hypothetical protein FBZ91_12175 [Nitrospirillum amazonense]
MKMRVDAKPADGKTYQPGMVLGIAVASLTFMACAVVFNTDLDVITPIRNRIRSQSTDYLMQHLVDRGAACRSMSIC